MNLQARYTIVRKIADGGTAEIFLATQHGAQGFEKTVVLKRIFSAFYADPQFRNMLIDEALIAMSLNHSNIVQVLDLGESDGQYVMALELVDGWTLDSLLRRTRALATGVPPALALYITAEVCRALAYAHGKSGADGQPLAIVHRDISPHNVLVSEQGEVKLTDFGIAKAQNRREKSLGNFIKGKIAFMSPEQASGAALDARSDLFSLGTMLYVMLCRRYPFDAPTDLEVLLLVKSGEFVPPEVSRPGMNPEIYRVLRRAMSRDPEQRYQRAEDMLHDVEQVMRVAFRAVGQTELKRWLLELSERDGVAALTRAIAPAPAATHAPAASGSERPGEVRAAADRAETIAVPAPVERADQRPEPSGAAKKVPSGSSTGPTSGPTTSPLAAALTGMRQSSAGMPAARLTQEASAFAPIVGPDATMADEDSPTVTMMAPPAGIGPPPPPAKALATGRRPAPPPPPAEARGTTKQRSVDRPNTFEPAVLVQAEPEALRTPPPEEMVVLQNLEPSSPLVAESIGARVHAVDKDVPAATVVAETTMPVRVPRPQRRRLFVLAGGIGILVAIAFWAERGTHPPAPPADAPVAARTGGGEIDRQPPLVVPSKPAAAENSLAATPPAGPPGPEKAAGPEEPAAPTAVASAASDGDPRTHATVEKIKPENKVAGTEAGGNQDPDRVAEHDPKGADDSAQQPGERAGTAGRPRISILLKSVPPGAEVTSSHRHFGSTPVSVRLRPGVRYALTFSAEGYRPSVKRIQVGKDSETELTVTLKRGSARQGGPVDPSSEAPPLNKPTNRNWWQKMFTR